MAIVLMGTKKPSVIPSYAFELFGPYSLALIPQTAHSQWLSDVKVANVGWNLMRKIQS